MNYDTHAFDDDYSFEQSFRDQQELESESVMEYPDYTK